MHLLQRFASTFLFLLICANTGFGADKLVLLSPHWEGIETEFENSFKEFYRAKTGRDITFEWLNQGGTSELLRFIKSEFVRKPDGIGVDLLFGGGVDPYFTLDKAGLLQQYRLPDSILKNIASSIGGMPMYDSSYRWYGATLAGFGIIYNKIVLKLMKLPVPKTWEDLGDPRLFTWVGSADPRSSGSVHMPFEIILQAFGWERGWEIITRIGANVRNFARGANQIAKDTALGEVGYGFCIDFYAWAQVEEAGPDKIGYVMPENLTIVNPDGIAILKGAPDLEAAKLFVNFVLSENGQKLWVLKKGVRGGPREFQLNRFSIMPALYQQNGNRLAVSMNPFHWRSDLLYDPEKGSSRWGLINDLMGVIIIDSRKELSRAWKKAIEAGIVESVSKKLATMPLTEAEAMNLAKTKWKDPEFRNRMMKEWEDFAKQKYAEVEKMADAKLKQRPRTNRWRIGCQ